MIGRIAVLAGLLVAGVNFAACNAAPPSSGTQTATSVDKTSTSFRLTPHLQPTPAPVPTATPVAFDRNAITTSSGCSGCLVVSSGRKTLAIDPGTGEASPIAETPRELPVYVSPPFVPSPNGKLFSFACLDDGTWAENSAKNLCLWGEGAASLPVVRAADLPRPLSIDTGRLSWSIDSRYFAFPAYVPDDEDIGVDVQETAIYLFDTATKRLTIVSEGAPFEQWGETVWSPRGSSFAITRTRNRIYTNVLIVDAAQGEMRWIPPDERALATSAGTPVWSTDGAAIAYSRSTIEPATPIIGVNRTMRQAVVIAGVDGTAERELTGEGGNPVAWSADREWLLVERYEPVVAASGSRDRRITYAVQADGGGEHRLAEGFVEITSPVFSPDGRRVAFVGQSEPAGVPTRGLYVVDTTGGKPMRLEIGKEPASPPLFAWTHDGSSLFYTMLEFCGRGGCNPGPLFMIGANGAGNPVRLTEDPISAVLGWLP